MWKNKMWLNVVCCNIMTPMKNMTDKYTVFLYKYLCGGTLFHTIWGCIFRKKSIHLICLTSWRYLFSSQSLDWQVSALVLCDLFHGMRFGNHLNLNIDSLDFLVFNATFSNSLVISWWSVLLVGEIGVPGENTQPTCRKSQTNFIT